MIYINSKDDFIKIDNESSAIIFAPSFCWLETLDIPTKNIKQAKKIADHMLSDRPAKYTNIEIQKKNDKFKVYCYDKNEIEDIVKKLNKPKSKVYFAYELTDKLNYLIDDNSFIEFLKSLKKIESKPLLRLNPNKNTIFNKIIIINILLFLAIILYSLDQYNSIAIMKENIKKLDYNDKSSYEIKSLIKSYNTKQKNSSNMKKYFKSILKDKKDLDFIEYTKGKN